MMRNKNASVKLLERLSKICIAMVFAVCILLMPALAYVSSITVNYPNGEEIVSVLAGLGLFVYFKKRN